MTVLGTQKDERNARLSRQVAQVSEVRLMIEARRLYSLGIGLTHI